MPILKYIIRDSSNWTADQLIELLMQWVCFPLSSCSFWGRVGWILVVRFKSSCYSDFDQDTKPKLITMRVYVMGKKERCFAKECLSKKSTCAHAHFITGLNLCTTVESSKLFCQNHLSYLRLYAKIFLSVLFIVPGVKPWGLDVSTHFIFMSLFPPMPADSSPTLSISAMEHTVAWTSSTSDWREKK